MSSNNVNADIEEKILFQRAKTSACCSIGCFSLWSTCFYCLPTNIAVSLCMLGGCISAIPTAEFYIDQLRDFHKRNYNIHCEKSGCLYDEKQEIEYHTENYDCGEITCVCCLDAILYENSANLDENRHPVKYSAKREAFRLGVG